ncbi:MAG: RIO1 family regulatory kinase/ATPase, partial [archaeon]
SQPAKMYKTLLKIVAELYQKARIVHGDLGEYNIMIWRGKPVIFDVSQAVSVEHPMAGVFLKRDISNINNYFENYRIKLRPVEEIYSMVVPSDAI